MKAQTERLQEKILKILREQPQRKIDIFKQLSKDFPNDKALQRFLRVMEASGLITSEGVTNKKVYKSAEGKSRPQTMLMPELLRPEDIPDQSSFAGYRPYLDDYFQSPTLQRGYRGYDAKRLENYKPNRSYLLSSESRNLLNSTPSWAKDLELGATYNTDVISNFLKQFTYNSSRLEGSKLNLASTIDVINHPEAFKDNEEKILIINHRRAIDWLVKCINYPEYGIEADLAKGSRPIKELHMILMNGLLKDESEGEIRQRLVEISSSSYTPSTDFDALEIHLNMIAIKSAQIKDLYERAFFTLAFISYLQAFNDGNKRTSRLLSNLPLIAKKRAPHPFHRVEEDAYHQAIVYFYESGDQRPLEKLWIESYLQGVSLFTESSNAFKSTNLPKVEMTPLRNLVVKEIVQKKLNRTNYVKLAKAAFSQDESIKGKYDFDSFQAIVVTACDKLSKSGIGAAIYDVTDQEIEDWAKIWQNVRKSFEA